MATVIPGVLPEFESSHLSDASFEVIVDPPLLLTENTEMRHALESVLVMVGVPRLADWPVAEFSARN